MPEICEDSRSQVLSPPKKKKETEKKKKKNNCVKYWRCQLTRMW